MVSKNEPIAEKKHIEERPQKPDHDAYPSLPGTPEPLIPEMNTKRTKRKSLPPELTSKRTKEEVSRRETLKQTSLFAH